MKFPSKNKNTFKKPKFFQKTKILSKIKILLENKNTKKSIQLAVKKLKFMSTKYKYKKSELLSKNQNFCQKSKFLSKKNLNYFNKFFWQDLNLKKSIQLSVKKLSDEKSVQLSGKKSKIRQLLILQLIFLVICNILYVVFQ